MYYQDSLQWPLYGHGGHQHPNKLMFLNWVVDKTGEDLALIMEMAALFDQAIMMMMTMTMTMTMMMVEKQTHGQPT